MTNLRTIPARLIVLPAGDSILSDRATHIELSDEGAGAFVVVRQEGRNDNTVAIDAKEWPAIRDAIQRMLNVAQGIEAETFSETDK